MPNCSEGRLMPGIGDLQPGDVAACFGRDSLSRAISYGTWHPLAPKRLKLGPSHVAVMIQMHDAEILWAESTTQCVHPCLIRGTRVRGCQVHTPTRRIADYVGGGGRVDFYRLTDIDKLDRWEGVLLASIVLKHFVGKKVGYELGHAILSGTRLIQGTSLMPPPVRDAVFCSALVAALLQRLNRLNRANPNRFNPGRLLRRLVNQGTYRYLRTYDSTNS